MSKDKISDYSSTANSNTDIAGINIDEGCAPSGINDAIRTLMAQLKTWQSGGQDVYIHPAGSASAPSITANGDTNTGIFFPAADTVGISTGGTERARVDSSGNVGIGGAPTGTKFEVYGGESRVSGGVSAGSTLNMGASSTGTNGAYIEATYYTGGYGPLKFLTGGSQTMTLDASGNLGVGTTSPYGLSNFNALTVGGASSGGLTMYRYGSTNVGYVGGNNSDELFIANLRSSGYLTFATNASERARIDSSGRFLVGTTNPDVGTGTGIKSLPAGDGANLPILAVTTSGSTSSTAPFQIYSTGASAYRFYVAANGQIYATNTSITGISDQRLKENIRDLDEGLATVMALKPRKFDWKEGKGKGISNDRGFIAQEFEEVLPDMIEEWRDPAPEGEEPYKAVNANLIPTLVKAIQELKATVDAQAARITALEQA